MQCNDHVFNFTIVTLTPSPFNLSDDVVLTLGDRALVNIENDIQVAPENAVQASDYCPFFTSQSLGPKRS